MISLTSKCIFEMASNQKTLITDTGCFDSGYNVPDFQSGESWKKEGLVSYES